MSACISKKIQGKSQGLGNSEGTDKEAMLVQKQGIVTILGSNYDAATSLRRTLSADMSSKKWLSENGLCPMKKIASSEELSLSHSHSHTKATAADSSSSSEGEDDYEEGFQIWNTIQQKEQHEEQPGQFDIWNSILSNKSNEETSKLTTTTTPYVHPLVRRSKGCLSEKSLQICTESLGSETGSDGFSSYTPSVTGDSEEEKEEEIHVTVQTQKEEEELQVPKQNYTVKKSLPRCFPPPLTSLSRQHGPSLHMRSHRDNGRLFLQAVSVPSHNNFCAQRQDGRLVLTFAEEDQVDELEDDYGAEEVESVMEQTPILSGGITSVRRLALMMNKSIALVNSNKGPKWSEKLNAVVNLKDVDVVQHSPLPPRPRARLISSSPASASGAFNAYEYYWRTKPTPKAALVPSPFTLQQNNYSSLENNSNQTSNDPQHLMVPRGKNGDYLVHNLKSCKDSRRSFLFWEPYCIAT